ncbi:MAG: hypothetical protein EOP84_34665, partial [Verrucomicrobiaceae bacterium]
MLRAGKTPGAWFFGKGKWNALPSLANVVSVGMDRSTAVRLRDFDGDGICELLVSSASSSTIYHCPGDAGTWSSADYLLPQGVTLLNERGEDNGLRFVDLNEDGFDDVFFSNEHRCSIHLWTTEVRPQLGWTAGWSNLVTRGERKGVPQEPPALVREGPNRNNGAWFHKGHLVVQNEDTAKLDGVVDRRAFAQLIAFEVPQPKSAEDSLASFQIRPGFKVELVASEPLVVDPIAFEWDASGRLWVVEMRDYPLGLDGKGTPGGVIKVLEDSNADGRYDNATSFLEGLSFPTGVMPWRAGALILAAPDIIYAEDTDGDGRADVR